MNDRCNRCDIDLEDVSYYEIDNGEKMYCLCEDCYLFLNSTIIKKVKRWLKRKTCL